MTQVLTFCCLVWACMPHAVAEQPQYTANPFVITLPVAAPDDSAGGIVTACLDGDGRMDYLVSVPGHIMAHGHDGAALWKRDVPIQVGGSSERVGLPGHHGPGMQAVDIDGDGAVEVLYLTQDNELHVLRGSDGALLWAANPPAPDGAERWEHLVVANFRGRGDRDLLLQATNKEGYRMGRYLAAYAIEDLMAGAAEPLWETDAFAACAHNGARVADLDGDGKDEVLGAIVLDAEGTKTFALPLRGHVDSIFTYDVLPQEEGLEAVALEEGGGNRVFLFNKHRLLWENHYQHWEPQNAAIGDFDVETPGLEVWCRSRFPQHQKPFVFNARGEIMAHYEMDHVAPEDWTLSGVEVIHVIDWTGEDRQLAAAKERHTEGDVCIFDPITGEFVARFEDAAARLYVADVAGDWREEIIVFAGNALRVYHNPSPNPNPGRPRLWEQPHYRRAKMTYNYYSP